MREICSAFGLAALAAGTMLSSPATAGNPADCHRPPPAWYTAPRVTHTYSVEYGSGYARGTHEYSARRVSARYYSSRHGHDLFGRW